MPSWALRQRGPGKRETYYELEGERIIVGRATDNEDADIQIADSTVSGKHCEISLANKMWCLVRDLNSTNGTLVNGRSLGRGGRSKLREGDRLELGDVTLELVILDDDGEEESPDEEDEEEEEEEEEKKPTKSAVGAPVLGAGDAALDPADFTLGQRIGVGSFGTVYLGTYEGEDVILKQAITRVANAADLLVLELLINERAAKQAPLACADFIGDAKVERGAAGAAYNRRLSQGLWLAWRYQGTRTLAYFLVRPTMASEILDMFSTSSKIKPEDKGRAATVIVMKQLFESLQRLHKVGLVHRDVKPANILLIEDEDARQVVRLIDLGGAAACLGEPLSYEPGLGSFDPLYAPPEQFLLPPDSPEPNFRTTRALWQKNAPDLFDTYCAGIVLLQMALPRVRTDSGLRSFRAELGGCDNDLAEWRERYSASLKDDSILSAGRGLGWDLAERLLTPTRSQRGRGRMTATEALAHPFLRL